jgi:hypothetical protein
MVAKKGIPTVVEVKARELGRLTGTRLRPCNHSVWGLRDSKRKR